MSRFFPHTAYAEDQPLARTILITHVATRGLTMGTMLGLGASGLRRAVKAIRKPASSSSSSSSPAATAAAAAGTPRSSLFRTVLRPAGVGGAVGTLAVCAGLAGRMRGLEDIEWRDRSWRLLENEGQLETDDWTYVGMAAAVAATVPAARRRGERLGWKGVTGAAGLGSVAGMMGYLAWRYAVNGGKFPERPEMKGR